jgi:hypothetical protein
LVSEQATTRGNFFPGERLRGGAAQQQLEPQHLPAQPQFPVPHVTGCKQIHAPLLHE